jgi:hypothetical protein
VEAPRELQRNEAWLTAVWALRVGFVGLVLVFAGLLLTVTGSSSWVLAVGMIIWLSAAVVTAAGFLLSRRELPDPQPDFWSLRLALLHDTVHARSS